MIDRLGITSIFVTHDQDEAIEVADQIMIINKGKLEQKGTPWEIYKNPQSPFVAGFIGESTIVEDVSSLRGFENASSWPGTKALIRPEYVEIGKAEEFRAFIRDGNRPRSPSSFSRERVAGRSRSRLILSWLRTVRWRKQVLHPGEEIHVLVHRAYMFNDNDSWVMENKLKEDPMPVHI